VQSAKWTNLPYQKNLIWKKQRGICPGCQQLLDPVNPGILDIHHVIPKKEGGSDKLTNLLLMHEHCDYETHYAKLSS